MNDDSTSSLDRIAPPPTPVLPSSSHNHAVAAAAETNRARGRREAQLADRRNKHRRVFTRKRGELLDDLLWSLDYLIYAEISVVYYMDSSFLRFALRAFVQFIFLTPKPSYFPQTPAKRPYIGAILGSNLFCLLLHTINNSPSAGEATRGYMHGGLVIDFIGQKGPSNKWHLIILDLLVIILQIICLSTHLTRQNLKQNLASSDGPPVIGGAGRELGTTQDLDHEERGLLREDSETPGSIELQTLNPASATLTTSTADNDDLEESYAVQLRRDAHIGDVFNSGQIIVADINPIQTVREQFWAFQMPYEEGGGHLPSEMRANVLRQLMRPRPAAVRRASLGV